MQPKSLVMERTAQKGIWNSLLEYRRIRNDNLLFEWNHSFRSNFSELLEVINEMGKGGDVYTPDSSVASYHEKKFKVFLEMLKDQQKYSMIMN